MKSNKQRRAEIKAARLARVAQASGKPTQAPMPGFAVAADKTLLASLNNTYGLLPDFYVDRLFTCRDCRTEEVWTAKQQKWWYEVAQGNINSQAVRCRPCRQLESARVEEARRVAQAGLQNKRREP
jgi:hypothetical protein